MIPPIDQTIYLVLENIRSAHNVGAILRTAEGLGVDSVFLCGYTPYPKLHDDDRLPHIAQRSHQAISKTALGAEATLRWYHVSSAKEAIDILRSKGATIVALEQTPSSVSLNDLTGDNAIALLVGNEVEGVAKGTMRLADTVAELPMYGSKESYNVAAASAMALYHLRNFTNH
jgi:23S rRNA (guanosine2251-2'-O)-methyltransferase